MAKLPLTKREQAIPYAKYYYLPLETERPEDAAFLNHPLPEEGVLPYERAAEFFDFDEARLLGGNGYYITKEGRGFTACAVELPNVTPQMVLWWFSWLNSYVKRPGTHGNLRYRIWFPPDHWDHCYFDEDDPDAGVCIAESLDLGRGQPRNNIITLTTDPAAIGISDKVQERVQREGSALLFGCGHDGAGNPGGVGVNYFKKTEQGCIWATCGWGGYTVRDGKVVALPVAAPASEEGIRCELLHNLLERRQLAKFLPELFAEYKDKPLGSDI